MDSHTITEDVVRPLARHIERLAADAAASDDPEAVYHMMHIIHTLSQSAMGAASVRPEDIGADVDVDSARESADAGAEDAPGGERGGDPTSGDEDAEPLPECLQTLNSLFDGDDPSASLRTESDVEEFKATLVDALKQAFTMDDNRVVEAAEMYKDMGRSVIEHARAEIDRRESAATPTDDFDDTFNKAWKSI